MWKALILICYSSFVISSEYHWRLPIIERNICSGDPQCDRIIKSRLPTHTYCQDQRHLQLENCSSVSLTASSRLTYLLGVNGIRNEIALDWKISNMNKVHWNNILQKMAERFLIQCSFDLDECTFLSDRSSRINVCQNLVFILSTEDDSNPYGYAVRKWYSEYVKEDSSFEEYEVRMREEGSENITNFSNMIWPTLELMGCASAKMPNGVLVTCFFYPQVTNASLDDFLVGAPCKSCMKTRPTCSAFFKGLCGIDKKDEVSSSDLIREDPMIILVVFIFVMFQNSY